MSLDQYAIQPKEIQQGVVSLRQRQQRLSMLSIFSFALLLVFAVGLYMQQDLVYGFFGLSHQVQQLHVPATVDASWMQAGKTDYFTALLSWFTWLVFKMFAAFIGAFFLVAVLKKIAFFQRRFQSFVLKCVGWLLSFILIWSGLSYWQHEGLGDDQPNQQRIAYQSNIQESEIAIDLRETEWPRPIKSYLLAQTALLHAPSDLAAARSYLNDLVQAEQHDTQFINYGFQPEQLWTMQQQVYGQATTPMAKSVAAQVAQADQLSNVVTTLLAVLMVLLTLIGIVLLVLSSMLKRRLQQIEQRLHE